jgi:hypothetical protein
MPPRFPEAWKRRIYRDNARELFAPKLAALEGVAAPAGG